MDILQYNDFSHIDWIHSQYDSASATAGSYCDYLKEMYDILAKYYRCEYVYKNEIISILPKLKKECGSHKTVAFNEFRVGNSIADIAFFNGESKAFEIKTDLDTPKRLGKQMEDYKRVFDRCYIVIPVDKYDMYSKIVKPETGIVLLSRKRGRISLEKNREAQKNEDIDVNILINCLHTEEYKTLVSTFTGNLPDVPDYMMYEACKEIMRTIPTKQLKEFFLEAVKKRKNNTEQLKDVPQELRQMCLSLGLSKRNIELLLYRLDEQLN